MGPVESLEGVQEDFKPWLCDSETSESLPMSSCCLSDNRAFGQQMGAHLFLSRQFRHAFVVLIS